MNKRFLLVFFVACVKFLSAQSVTESEGIGSVRNWFISPAIGVQMSGIKDEDFVAHNRAPLFNVMAGKWFSPELALQIGYKGPYYNAIADDKKHHYYFVYGEALMNVNSFFKGYNKTNPWRLLLHAGAGYYYNHDYKQPNICANLGITNGYRLTKHFQANVDVAAIIGWDIYQGDEDILPGVSVGLSYLF